MNGLPAYFLLHILNYNLEYVSIARKVKCKRSAGYRVPRVSCYGTTMPSKGENSLKTNVSLGIGICTLQRCYFAAACSVCHFIFDRRWLSCLNLRFINVHFLFRLRLFGAPCRDGLPLRSFFPRWCPASALVVFVWFARTGVYRSKSGVNIPKLWYRQKFSRILDIVLINDTELIIPNRSH